MNLCDRLEPKDAGPDEGGLLTPPAIGEIVARYREPLIRHLARLASPADAEDLAQVALAKVARGLATFRGESSLSTWIFRIATHTALDHVRSRAHREAQATEPVPPPDGGEHDGGHDFAGTDEGVRRTMDRQEMGNCVREFVDRLRSAYAEILALAEFEELSSAEIAARLGITPGAAKIRLHRARAALKRELEAGCELYVTAENTIACDRRHPCSCRH